jgi:hypothetical protein
MAEIAEIECVKGKKMQRMKRYNSSPWDTDAVDAARCGHDL